jgi:hypothetical protein
MTRRSFSFLDSDFRSTAKHLKMLDYSHPDLALERVVSEVANYLPKRLEKARLKYGLNDPLIIWELLSIDAVISLENIQGKLTRVAVSLQHEESNAYRLFFQINKPNLNKIRQALHIDRHWVFVIEGKFPTDDEWIDILYNHVDLLTNSNGCQMIVL